MDNNNLSVLFILLSYKRPQNLNRIINAALSIKFNKNIIVSNNNPDINILSFINEKRKEVKVVQQKQHLPAAQRFKIAMDSSFKYFIAIDDDLFLKPQQIELLIEYLWSNEDIPHGGPWGQKFLKENKYNNKLKGWSYPDSEVDVLNRAYAFTRNHVERFFDLLYSLGYESIQELGPADDIVLSFSGKNRPYCHNLGLWESCPTSNTDGIALWKENNFAPHRLEVFHKLQQITGRFL